MRCGIFTTVFVEKFLVKLTEFKLHIRKLVKVGGVVYRSDSDGDGGRTLPDVVPVHVGEPVQLLHVLYVLNSLVSTFTQSETGN